LTVRLNPHLRGAWGDLAWLNLDLALFYGLIGALPGLTGAAGVALLRRWGGGGRLGSALATAGVGSLLVVPLVYLLLLPGVGLGLPWLTDLLSAGRPAQAGALLGVSVGASGLSLLLAPALRRWAAGWKTTPRRILVLLGLLAAGILLGLQGLPAGGQVGGEAATTYELPPAVGESPPPVVLLCTDGADLDDVILPMVEAGELPTLARFMEEGTWGSLATLEPTLSPVIWTTLATGRPAREHGIHQFLYFRPPGMKKPVYEFPLHLGLNFRVVPLAEKIPGLSRLTAPYTSTMRQSEALWELVERRYPVGVYRWLMSWPAEAVRGFSVAGGIAWAQFDGEGAEGQAIAASGATTFPPQLKLPERRPSRAVTDEELAAFVDRPSAQPRRSERMRQLRNALTDPTARDLPLLMKAFDARLVAAAFFPVDSYHHLYHRDRRRGGPFAGAIAEGYRLLDRRLGELLAALPEGTRVILVSDHGFDFEAGHHTRAPAGIFFARGPGFEAGKRVEGLTVFDVAPLVLHLLDLPIPQDLPSGRSGSYRRALAASFLAEHAGRTIPSYGPRQGGGGEEALHPQDQEIKEVLRSLGYL
jgi:hypothetical protein